MNDSPAPIIELHDVSFAYHRGSTVVDKVSASVAPGRFTALIGPNASGKTTLIKLMLGLLSPHAGRVTLEGSKLTRVPFSRRAALLSYVPQRSASSFAFSVGHVVAMGRYALPWDPVAFQHALDACELNDLVDKPYVELSIGQQQRVLLARALAQSAGQGRAILLDEPTSAMDLSHIHRTMALLQSLARQGLAVAAVLHDLNLAARYADDIWLLHRGSLAASGTWNQVLTPEILQPIYNVSLQTLPPADPHSHSNPRPVFDVHPSPIHVPPT